MTAASFIVGFVQIWGILGLLVALAFVVFGISRIDEDAAGAFAFRPLILPGLVLLWPLVAWRWWILATGRDNWRLRHAPPRRAHGLVWIILAVLIPLTIGSALMLRQSWPSDIAPVQIEAPKDVSP